MTAAQDTYQLMRDLASRGIEIGFDDANTLRRAQITLRRWSEAECGNSNDFGSWAIERDEETGKPYRVVYPHDRVTTERYAIPDRETAALRRVKAICDRLGLHYYHQTDPRGCALYVAREPIPANDYNRAGVACAV